jgi:predicted porin
LENFYMKKTLVALAVLAASGASFAQVTLTGGYAWGYRASHSATGADTAGLGIDTAGLKFAASEDLGGGTKMAVYLSIDSTTRKSISGGNSGADLSTNYGTFSYSMDEGSEFVTRAAGQEGGTSFDGKVTSGLAPATDNFTYTAPAFGPVKVAFDYTEADQSLGLGAAGDATDTAQRQYQLRAAYAAGPLNATARYAFYDSKEGNAQQSNRVRLAASYDLGMAKVGAGYSRLTYGAGTRTDTAATVNVPLGATTLGASWANRNFDNAKGNTATDGNATGFGLTASYALSKRTSLNLSYARWNKTAADAEKSTETNLLLAHSF